MPPLKNPLLFITLFATLVFTRGMPMLHADSRIHMDATVNGNPVRFAFDTGSESTILFAQTADRIGLRWTPPSDDVMLKAGEVAAGFTQECELILDADPVKFVFHVVQAPLFQEMEIDGLIGWNNLRNNILLLEGPLQQIHFLAELPKDIQEWQVVEIRATREDLVLDTPAGGILIDTGDDSGVRLASNQWQSWKSSHANEARTMEAYSTLLKPINVSEVYWADTLELGSLLFNHVTVGKSLHASDVGIPDYLATIGLDALRQLVIILDGPSSRCYIRRERYAVPVSDHNRLGAVFTPEIITNEALIASVAAHSPAEEAGIMNGDQLIKIEDLDVTSWRTQPGILPLHRFWSQPSGTPIKLSLKRGDESFETTVILRDILAPAR